MKIRHPFIRLEPEKCKVEGCENEEIDEEGYCEEHEKI